MIIAKRPARQGSSGRGETLYVLRALGTSLCSHRRISQGSLLSVAGRTGTRAQRGYVALRWHDAVAIARAVVGYSMALPRSWSHPTPVLFPERSLGGQFCAAELALLQKHKRQHQHQHYNADKRRNPRYTAVRPRSIAVGGIPQCVRFLFEDNASLEHASESARASLCLQSPRRDQYRCTGPSCKRL